MKFTYAYKSKDGVRHEGEICASSRDNAFSALRSNGIKPIRVDLAPGFLNRILALGKRTLAIVILAGLVVVAFFVIRSDKEILRMTEASRTSAMPRHHIYGDPLLLSEMAQGHYREQFAARGDAVLAHYAQPGMDVSLDMDAAEAIAALEELCKGGSAPALEITEADLACREVSEVKRIVLGMREEFLAYLSDGIGTPKTYLKRLNERRRRERQIYLTAQGDLKRTSDPQRWEVINNSLRSIGLPVIQREEDEK